jgi:hypothetical protein
MHLDPVQEKYWPELNGLFEELNREQRSGSDHGLVLVSTSMAEKLLRRTLEMHFIDKARLAEKLLGGKAEAPLSSLSAKTDMCLALGLIPQHLADRIGAMRAIRNLMAHELGASLVDQSAQSHIATMGKGIPFQTSGPRGRFGIASIIIHSNIIVCMQHAAQHRRSLLELPLIINVELPGTEHSSSSNDGKGSAA